jgi:hypothetical protein
LELPIELPHQILYATRAIPQLMEAHSCRTNKGETTYGVLFCQGGRNEVTIDDGYKQTGKLSETIKQCVPIEDETVSEMTEKEIDNQVVKRTD